MRSHAAKATTGDAFLLNPAFIGLMLLFYMLLQEVGTEVLVEVPPEGVGNDNYVRFSRISYIRRKEGL
jgi:hypothetical protein